MKLSDKGLTLLEQWEGKKSMPYNDKTGFVITEWCEGATIGVGHLIPEEAWSVFKDGLSDENITSLLKNDVGRFERRVNSIKSLTQNQFDALVIFCFNIGETGFKNSSVVKILNGETTPYKSLESAWKAWKKQDGVVVRGLVNRRAKEWKLYQEVL